MSRCRLCCNGEMRDLRASDPKKYSAMSKRWAQANPEKVAEGRKRCGPENKEKRKLSRAAHEARNPGAQAAKSRRTRANNPEGHKATLKNWQQANPEKLQGYYRKYQKTHPDKIRASSSRRRAMKQRAIPVWEADALSRELEWRKTHPGMTLDHIVPITPPMATTLGGKPPNWWARKKFIGPLLPLVYGFHTEPNWAPLPFHENARKGNRDWPDSPWS